MDNRFFSFSPDSFEQFARSVALSVLGPGVTVFGNGPDGGREATFNGEVAYPYPPATQWSGYGVIQAKCKEKIGSTKENQQWAAAQLTAELTRFVRSEKRKPKPEYYIFVTNVELSSAPGGGRDQVESYFRSRDLKRLGLKGHAIWDGLQLDAFLSKHAELRKRFAAFLTPGDVLAAMLANIERHKPNMTRILSTFLEKELRTDEASRLDQAGNRTEEHLRLAQLFFDLPASREPQLSPPDEKPDGAGRLPKGILDELLRSGSRKLDPQTMHEQATATREELSEHFPNRFVLLGGPGSGKSTVTQFLAQIHRAALLARREAYFLDPISQQIIQETEQLCSREGLQWPPTPRYPFRVELNRFAKGLASKNGDHVHTLEAYLLNQLRREHEMAHPDFLDWLSEYPSLLILDGLDEVPPTSNRGAVVQAVNGFLAELRQSGADVFVVATSREQGYGGEFAGGAVAFRHILPLSRARALHYVELYAYARFGKSNPVKAADVLAKLQESAQRELTAQLMRSPLQVTFMATVVAARGDPGEDRWQLFASYYRTIYDRERQKAVPPYDAVLAKQQPTIDRLHHDVGFLLQYRGETEGATAISLPIDQFRQLLDGYLTEIGREGVEKDELVRLITEAASDRLVFLTSRVVGELSFDVRSLQEYMAAECLMTGEPELVKARLKSIASTSYWRNVFLFAASKCFADTQSRHFQDAIRLLCEDLNTSSDPLLEAIKAGSDLAADILQSGAVAENPNHARHLARIALALLSQSYLNDKSDQHLPIDQKLASIYSEVLRAVYISEVELRVGQSIPEKTIGAWRLLTRLVGMKVQWAVEVAERSWPSHSKELLSVLLRSSSDLVPGSSLEDKFVADYWSLPVSEVANFFRMRSGVQGESNVFKALQDFFGFHARAQINLRVHGSKVAGANLTLTRTFERRTPLLYQNMPQMPPSGSDASWLQVMAAKSFMESPEAVTLARVLEELAHHGRRVLEHGIASYLPWPLANCLLVCRDVQELRELVSKIRQDLFGKANDWQTSEASWVSRGIDIEEFPTESPDVLATTGGLLKFPYNTGSSFSHAGDFTPRLRHRLLKTAQTAKAPSVRHAALWFWGMSGENAAVLDEIQPSEFEDICVRDGGWLWSYVNPATGVANDAWLEAFDSIGRLKVITVPHVRDNLQKLKEWSILFQAAVIDCDARRKPFRLGLLRLLSRIAALGIAIDTIPAAMLGGGSTSPWEPCYRWASLVVRLSQPSLTREDAERLADKAVELLEDEASEPNERELVFGTLESHLGKVPSIVHFILRLHEKIPSKTVLGAARCERLLRRALRDRVSDLQLEHRVKEVGLPVVPHANSRF